MYRISRKIDCLTNQKKGDDKMSKKIELPFFVLCVSTEKWKRMYIVQTKAEVKEIKEEHKNNKKNGEAGYIDLCFDETEVKELPYVID